MTLINVIPLRDYDWSLSRVGPFPFNPAVVGLVAGFYGVAMWMGIKLNFQVYFAFKRHRCLYFWSMLVTAWGIELHSLGFLLKLLCPRLFAIIISKIGRICDVTGLATVPYPRLHLSS